MRRICLLLCVIAALLLAGELVLRFGVGLGNPVLYERDPQIDYMLKPSASYSPFGNSYTVNSLGMRAREPSLEKGGCEIRVLAVGDSVLNGGGLIGQADVATAIVEKALSTRLSRPVWVGNVSAGGWAPENQRAYLARFGWHDPDVIVFVFSTHDVTQRAAFLKDMGQNFPLNAPVLALQEAVMRYLPRYLPMLSADPKPAPEGPDPRSGTASEVVMADLIRQAVSTGKKVLVLHHRTLPELRAEVPQDLLDDGEKLSEIALENGATYMDLGPLERAGNLREDLYRDSIHYGSAGQRMLAAAVLDGVAGELLRIAGSQSPECGGHAGVN